MVSFVMPLEGIGRKRLTELSCDPKMGIKLHAWLEGTACTGLSAAILYILCRRGGLNGSDSKRPFEARPLNDAEAASSASD